jgi:hypothetical protein
MSSERGEQIRRAYEYRRLIMRGKVRLPVRGARGLVGPDCAYHLYQRLDTTDPADRDSPDDRR